jgi:hypothetical protein
MQPTQRRPSRRDKKQNQVRKAIGVLVALCLFTAVVGYFYLSARAEIRPIDETTFCPTDTKGPNSVTTILIDRTDTFNPTQEAAIRDRLNDVKDHTSRYDLLEIYTVESTQDKLLKPEFSMCNPGRGEDTNKWTGNPHLIEQRWEAFFADPLQHLFDSILQGATAQISPIMESIQSIVVTRLGTQEIVSKKIPRRLIIISDLLQYVKDYSQYQPLSSFKQFKTLPYYQNVRSDLSGISIEIWYVRRQSTLALQKDKHIEFWKNYLSDQGGSVDKVWLVPGT